MNKIFEKPYEPKNTEEKIYKLWEESSYFNPDKSKGLPAQAGKKTFTVMLPPPNVTGALHMGHALNAALSDVIVRYKRMKGFKTLWLPGTDHAGIATQNVVEKDLKKQGISRHDLGKEKFLEKVWEWKEKYGHIILDQLKKIGASLDWSRTAFTMDKDYAEAVKTAFLEYKKKGWIYQGERVVNWCPRCYTSLSDLELEYKEEKGKLWFIKYPIKNGRHIVVATTRPETMLGDTAVAVNPKDKRYKDMVGKIVILPIEDREIPIVADMGVEQSFGTGAVKVTPAHDALDAEIAGRHNLEFIKVIDERARMIRKEGQICHGLKASDCRNKVVEKLLEIGAIEKIENYVHNVAFCYRCGTIIEPILSKQWFVKMDELAKIAIKAVKSGKIKFYPKRFEKIYFNWLNNIKDWCISRQIWWGHKIPIEGSEDVLDTWFSSALWPFATLGWPTSVKTTAGKPKKISDLENFYPGNFLFTARDIINLWVARMIYSGIFFTKKIPFSKVFIHPTVLTKDGKRMSKSLGTGIDPMDLIEKYGADATRFGLVWQTMGGQDIRWDENAVMAGKKFANKIWNASRFVLAQVSDVSVLKKPAVKTAADKKILAQLAKTKKSIEKHLDKFEFGPALHELYDFFWHQYCDVYLEESKKQLAADDLKENTQKILYHVLYESLKLFHPFMPFITEEIYQHLFTRRSLGEGGPKKEAEFLMIDNWD